MLKKTYIFSLILASQLSAGATQNSKFIDLQKPLNKLETEYHRKIGLYAFDSNSKKVIAYNKDKRFPFQSTFKLIGVAALLYSHQKTPVLNEKVTVKPDDIVPWGPVSHQYLNKPISYKALCEAAIVYSDNTAINLIIRKLGGIKKINSFARKVGAKSFTLSHMESNLNSSLKCTADTSTPKTMGILLRKLLNSNILTIENKRLFKKWLRNNTTAYNRIRAGVPLGWTVANKTGSGKYGIANDLGIVWSPACKPITLSIYTVGQDESLLPNSELVSKITSVTIKAFSKFDNCHQLTDLSKVF